MNQNFYNSNSSGFDQTQPPQFPVIHPPPQEISIEILHDQENVINAVQTFLRKFNRISFFETPKVLLLAWDRVFEIKDALGNKQYKPEDIKELFRKLLDDLQNIHEELAEYINIPGIPDTMCDVHLVNNPTPLEAKDHFKIVINSNDDYSSSDDDYLYNENIEYVEASPHDSELVSLEDKLRVFVFPITLVGDAWRWFDEIKGSITSWVDVGIKRLHDDLRVTAAQVYISAV
uniref:Uncharacterized protein n=1 Tax=Tanacetum cinerariifolium TaxID=118510 RepID=A0A6L2JSD5_TANCI|nr:hypothetical protein [Tanacetum cinerariifolium]